MLKGACSSSSFFKVRGYAGVWLGDEVQYLVG